MGKIRFLHCEDTAHVSIRDFDPRETGDAEGLDEDHTRTSAVSEEELDTQAIRMMFPGGTDELQLFEIKVDPGARGQPHVHAEDEIMYILEGSIEFGNRTYPAGSAVYVPGHTMYSFRAGPDGLRFLNFRARADYTYITKDDFMAMRRDARR